MGSCQAPKPQIRAASPRTEAENLQRIIRKLQGGTASKTEIDQVLESARRGDVVESNLGFLALEIAKNRNLIDLNKILEIYIARLREVSGSGNILTAQSLERILNVSPKPSPSKRGELLLLAQETKNTQMFTDEEKRIIEKELKTVKTEGMHILLASYITTKHESQDLQWSRRIFQAIRRLDGGRNKVFFQIVEKAKFSK